MQIGNL